MHRPADAKDTLAASRAATLLATPSGAAPYSLLGWALLATGAAVGVCLAAAAVAALMFRNALPGKLKGRRSGGAGANAAIARATTTARMFNTWSCIGYAMRAVHVLYLLLTVTAMEELRDSAASGASDPLAWVALALVAGLPLFTAASLYRMAPNQYDEDRTQALWHPAVRSVKYEGRLWSVFTQADTVASAAVVVFLGKYPVLQIMALLGKQFVYVACCACRGTLPRCDPDSRVTRLRLVPYAASWRCSLPCPRTARRCPRPGPRWRRLPRRWRCSRT